MDNIYNLWNDDDEQLEASIIVYYNIKMLRKDAAKTSLKRVKESIKEIYGNNDEKPPVRIFILYKDTFVQRGSSGRIAINRRRNSGLLKSNAESPFVSILIFWYSSRPNRDEIEKFPNNFAFNKSNTRNGERGKFIKNVSPNYEKESVDSTFRITFIKHGDSSEAFEIDVVATSNGCSRLVRYRYSQKPVPCTSDELNRQKKQNYGNVDDNSGNFLLNLKPTNEGDNVGSEMYYENLEHENGSDDINSETNHEALKHDIIVHSISQSKHDSESNDDSSRKVYEIFKHSNGSVNGNVTCFPKISIHDIGSDDISSEKNLRNLEQKQDYGEIGGNKNGVNRIHDKKSDGARISPGKCYQNSRRTSGSLKDNPETLNPYLDSNFDSVDYFNDVDEIAFKKSGFESLAIFAVLLKTIAIIVEEYSEYDTKGNKNSKNGRGTKFRMVMIPSGIFEEAMRQCHIATVELTYSNLFPSDCRMLVCLPIYRNGYIHRKDQV